MSDRWAGLDQFLTPGTEILLPESADEVVACFGLSDAEIRRIGEAARERILASHTNAARARELEAELERVPQRAQRRQPCGC